MVFVLVGAEPVTPGSTCALSDSPRRSMKKRSSEVKGGADSGELYGTGVFLGGADV